MKQIIAFRLVFAAVLVALLGPANAATLQCNADAGKLILQDEKLAYQAIDKELNAAWARARTQLSEKEFLALREIQRSWLSYRDLMASAIAGYGADEKAEHCADYVNAQAVMTRERTQFLQAWPQSSGGSWSGHYQDSFGGSIQLVEQAGVAYFEIGTVRGYGMSNGQIAGFGAVKKISKVSDGVVEFRARDSELGEIIIRLHRQGARLRVETQNAESFHGHNAYFDGDYVRVRGIPDSQRAKIIRSGQSGPSVEIESE